MKIPQEIKDKLRRIQETQLKLKEVLKEKGIESGDGLEACAGKISNISADVAEEYFSFSPESIQKSSAFAISSMLSQLSQKPQPIYTTYIPPVASLLLENHSSIDESSLGEDEKMEYYSLRSLGGLRMNFKKLPKLNLDFSALPSLSFFYAGCEFLTEAPQTTAPYYSKDGSFVGMFYGCSNLQSIPELNTSNGINFLGMFAGCSNLESIPELNTSNGTDFRDMFAGCSNLKSIPELNTSNGINFLGMFNGCSNLESIPGLNTSNGTDFNDDQKMHSRTSTPSMFDGCKSLTTLGTEKIKDSEGNLIDPWIFNADIDFGDCPLDHDSIVHVFNHLSSSDHTITISSTTDGYLSEDEREIPDSKNWWLEVK